MVEFNKMTEKFILDKRLENDTIFIKDLDFSKLLLMNDCNYPWLILVPRLENITEIYELSLKNQQILMSEITKISQLLKREFVADKINVAALGNMVSQLHIHIVARYKNDISWPNPIWGNAERKEYNDKQLSDIKAKLIDLF